MIALRYMLLVLAAVSFVTVFVTGVVNGAMLIGFIALGGAGATSQHVRDYFSDLTAVDPTAQRSTLDDLDRPAAPSSDPHECDCPVDHGEAGYDADRTTA